jgi:transcriptional regulator with XRE-family HTH domain
MGHTALSDEIREAVRKSGRTNYDVAKVMGVCPSTLWRFTQGQQGLSLASLDRLADVLDLHITVGRKGRD